MVTETSPRILSFNIENCSFSSFFLISLFQEETKSSNLLPKEEFLKEEKGERKEGKKERREEEHKHEKKYHGHVSQGCFLFSITKY